MKKQQLLALIKSQECQIEWLRAQNKLLQDLTDRACILEQTNRTLTKLLSLYRKNKP